MTTTIAVPPCPLCTAVGGPLAWRGHGLRVIVPIEPGQPGLARVVVDRHVAEFSDLDDTERVRLMQVVAAVERVVRDTMSPDKVNLASLGNMVPHLHWHVIPRWRDDARFPASPWSPVPASATAHADQATPERANADRGNPSHVNPDPAQRAAEREAWAIERARHLRVRLAHGLVSAVGGEGVLDE